ncbi:hypothetical protein LCGC14_2157700, partial [marine sediment metagenome]
DNGTIRLIVLSDQPYGIMKDTECSYHAQFFVNGSEVLPNSVTPLILATDPVNPNYHDNVVLWQYGTLCRRRVRLIEGRYRERWLIDNNPNGRVEIRHNKTGALRVNLGSAYDVNGNPLQVTVIGDSEIIEASEFNRPDIVFPVDIRLSLTVYPDAHIETSTVDGGTGGGDVEDTWANIRVAVGSFSRDDNDFDSPVTLNCGFVADTWKNNRRLLLLLDTSPLTSAAVLLATTLSTFGRVKLDAGTPITPNVNVYSSNPDTNIAIIDSDHDDMGTTPYADTPITFAGYNLGTPGSANDMAFNSAGLGAISLTDITKLSLRNANYDVGVSTPTWTSVTQHYISTWCAEKGAGYKPKLVVTYVLSGGASQSASQSALISEIIS